MSLINLADAKVVYEDQTLPVINLISKLQIQLQEASTHIAAIASALGELQTALLNSNTVEVKLTLSKEDFGRFRTLGGMDDNERIRKAVMTAIYPETGAAVSSESLKSHLKSVEPVPAVSLSAEPHIATSQRLHSVLSANPETPQEYQSEEVDGKTKTTRKCPRCQSLIVLSEPTTDHWPVEVTCSACGTKCLVKSKMDSPIKTDGAEAESLDETTGGKLFDILSI
jgi:DNA-directed RNA polymerase subunit RPC12/RpoP